MSNTKNWFILATIIAALAMLQSCSGFGAPSADEASPMGTYARSEAGGDTTGLAEPVSTEPPSPMAEAKSDSPAKEGTAPSMPNIQSGSLTAGSFDDNLYLDVFKKFISDTLQNRKAQDLPTMNVGHRVMIQVCNEEGKPIGNARVGISEQKTQKEAVTLITGSDGRAVFPTS